MYDRPMVGRRNSVYLIDLSYLCFNETGGILKWQVI